ncbi:MAG TPA: HAD hydrolase-like protein, partial [Mucilaginibacter sp.]|nr:HAD hydrolase-like protein [Mucilaginibacter sp.]
REQLAAMVGWEGQKVLATLMPDYGDEERQRIYARVTELRRELLPKNGGVMYEGVKDGLKALAEKYQLYIVSNCAVGIIRLFIDWAGISDHIIDEIAYGTNHKSKNYNIRQLMERHDLQSPVYIGDTEGDAEQSRLAGIPFVFMSYGFGNTDNYDLRFDSFGELTRYFLKLDE